MVENLTEALRFVVFRITQISRISRFSFVGGKSHGGCWCGVGVLSDYSECSECSDLSKLTQIQRDSTKRLFVAEKNNFFLTLHTLLLVDLLPRRPVDFLYLCVVCVNISKKSANFENSFLN